jgi:hypothetical protein
MKEVTQEVYLKWYEDMLLGESLRTSCGIIQQKSEALHTSNKRY